MMSFEVQLQVKNTVALTVVGTKNKSNLLPREIKIHKTTIQNPQDIAKEFFNFLTSTGPNLAKKIRNTDKAFQDFCISQNEKMQFEKLNFDEFEEALKSLKNKTKLQT